MLNMRRWLSFVILLTILTGTLTACGEGTASTTNHDLSMAPMSAMPDEVKAAP